MQSAVDHGATFAVTIPCDEGEASDAPLVRRVVALAPGQPRYRLLIVDDNSDNRRVLAALLRPVGFDLREAANGQEALDIWATWAPHLIWMDMRMPVMDGYDAATRIKQTAQGQATVIIALTASALEEEHAVARSAGCDEVVRKPFREHEVFEIMQKHLGVRYAHEAEPITPPAPAADRFALNTAALADLPGDVLDGFRDAVNNADMELAQAMIARIRQQNAAFADALAELVETYRFDTLLALFQQQG